MIQEYLQTQWQWLKSRWQGMVQRAQKRRTQKECPLPVVTHPHHQNIADRQKKVLLFFALTLVFIGIYGFIAIDQRVKAYELTSVWVPKQDVLAPIILDRSQMTTIRIPQRYIPNGSFDTWDEPRLVIRDLPAYSIITRHDLAKDGDPDSVTAQFTDLYGFSMDEDWFTSSIPDLYPHDRVDVLSTNPAGISAGVSRLVEYVEVIQVRTNKNKKSLVLNITKGQAESLLFARSLRLPLQIVVHPSSTDSAPQKNIVNPQPDETGDSVSES